MLENFLSVSLLILGFVFTFFISGALLVESFIDYLPARIKFPLYFILSVIVSTCVVYLVSLILGFSRFSILLSFLLFFFLFPSKFSRVIKTVKFYLRHHAISLGLGLFIFALFLISLYPGIFTWYNGYIVISSVNWQDTPMHMGIIQSISQGNFPPQAPYYAGVPLSYYYFIDFHSAILATLYGRFFPRILVYDNPFFAFMLFLSIYALSYELIGRKITSLISAFTGCLFGNYIFIKFIGSLFENKSGLSFFQKAIELLTHNTYSMEYGQLFQIANFADYFLQNRPMMIGIPTVLINLTLLFHAFQKQDKKIFFFSGLATGLLFRFQLFALVSLVFLFLLLFFFHQFLDSNRKLGESFRYMLLYFLPIVSCWLIFGVETRVEGHSLVDIFKSSLRFGPWSEQKSFVWHIKFLLSNFGLPFIITFLVLFLRLARFKLDKLFDKLPAKLILISFFALFFFAVPYVVTFTIYSADMFKFFYFAILFSVISTFWFLEIIVKNRFFGTFLTIILLTTSTFSSLLTLANSFLNKNYAYSYNDFKAGSWIRENTPPKSVFIQMPTVHSSVTQIGGRLRVLSYINWPYTHGYKDGFDNVFTRLEDIRKIYGVCEPQMLKAILAKYGVNYVYYGDEEKREFPDVAFCFESLDFLKKVYSQDGILIYEAI